MNSISAKITSIIFLFLLGYILKRINFLTKDHASLFLKIVMYVALPALIIPSVASMELSLSLLRLPFIAILIMLILFSFSFFIIKLFSASKQTTGTFLLSVMIMNLSFVLPFFLAVAGEETIPYFLFFNLGHDILLFSFVYTLACYYGRKEGIGFDWKRTIKKLLSLPPLWALLVGLFLNFTNTPVPSLLEPTLTIIGGLLVPLALLALGVYFEFQIKKPILFTTALLLRMGVGFLLGLFFIWLFSLEGIEKLVVLLCSLAPIGFNTLVFSSLENLDKETAAQFVSFALFVGMIVYSIVLLFIA